MTSESPTPEQTTEAIIAEVSAALNQPAKTDAPFPVVGIAASAGGLEAFTALIRHLPTDTGMAFVLIQHLAPDHESLLSEILDRVTAMRVQQAQDGMMVEPNLVYVIPPNTQMTLVDGLLQLAPRQKIKGQYHPGDAFFESLAADRGNKAIAVVLSGADGDGSHGLKAVKVAGGVTFAQCEDTAKFDSMPNTAVATGNVDFVLPPETIAAEITKLSHSPFLSYSEPMQVVKELPVEPGDPLTTIFALLRTTTGIDFTHYKPTTLDRRLQRRLLLHKLESLEEYAQYLQAHPGETQALYEEILIHVTSFFRDPEIFEALKAQVFPKLSQKKASDVPLRVWIAGCSTGEEVYSIAMCLIEFFDDRAIVPPIQLFATDISETAIRKARAGCYLDGQMAGVSQERQSRFFVSLPEGGYQISSAVRELCVFARHNLGGDPPFSNLDLISCRNVLIYLGDSLQEHIMSLFHYSLNEAGFLLLGTSESVKNASALFTPVDEACKIYARKLTLTRPLLSFTPSAQSVSTTKRQPQVPQSLAPVDLARSVDQLIANRYAPVSVVVDDQMQILQLRGDLDPYLKLTPGTTALNLLLMAREGLAIALRTALYQAQTQKVPVRQEHIKLEADERSLRLNLEVLPFRPSLAEALYFLVLLETVPPLDALSPVTGGSLAPTALERELAQLRQALEGATQRELAALAHLQAVIQQQDHLNQSLRVANEEIISSNEELQSTNEELQTAKEEIQATNEELATTNDELLSRNLQQNRDNSDLNNFLTSISVPIVMLTNELGIRRFTPTAQRLFSFIPTDVGRPFSDLTASFDISQLEPMLLEVLETLNTQEQEIQTQAGYWYSLRIRPYRNTENQIDGVTLVFVDIDALKRHAATLEVARNHAETIIETVQTPLVVLDAALRVQTANRSFYDLFQVAEAATGHPFLFELGKGQWSLPQLRSLLAEVLTHERQVQNLEVEHTFEPLGPKTLLLNGCKLPQADNADLILLLLEDITERQQFETERAQLLSQEQSARQQAEAANRAKDEFLSNLSHELRNPLNTMLGWAQLLRTRQLDKATVTRALEVMERSARAQTQLIEDLLDLSRITSGKLHLNTRTLDLVSVVNGVIESVQLSAETKSIQIVSQLTSATVLGDGDRLQQVLWNLLSNALKFTPPGGRVEVTVAPVQTQAELRVSDTGQGIQADLLPYVFDRFRQGDSSTSKSTQGLGLGLAIVRHIIELHGGTVQAASPGEGQGTTMTVSLPLRSLPLELTLPSEREAMAAESLAVASQESLLQGLRILAVDDDEDNLDLMKFSLEDAGAVVVTVTSAAAAIAALTASPGSYKVLLADLGMPDEDGFSLIRQVRALDAEAGGQIPAAALTAYVSDREQQQTLAAGFQRHMAKPIEPTQLILMVAALAERVRND